MGADSNGRRSVATIWIHPLWGSQVQKRAPHMGVPMSKVLTSRFGGQWVLQIVKIRILDRSTNQCTCHVSRFKPRINCFQSIGMGDLN